MSGSDGCRAFHFTSCRWNMTGLECDIGGNGEQREELERYGSVRENKNIVDNSQRGVRGVVVDVQGPQ